MIRTQIKGR